MVKCELCKKAINKDDEFVLEGKYPSRWASYWRAMGIASSMGSAGPGHYGKIFHKSCYLEKNTR